MRTRPRTALWPVTSFFYILEFNHFKIKKLVFFEHLLSIDNAISVPLYFACVSRSLQVEDGTPRRGLLNRKR